MPIFPWRKNLIRKSFEGPAVVNGNKKENFDAFRRNRDEIKFWLEKTFKV